MFRLHRGLALTHHHKLRHHQPSVEGALVSPVCIEVFQYLRVDTLGLLRLEHVGLLLSPGHEVGLGVLGAIRVNLVVLQGKF